MAKTIEERAKELAFSSYHESIRGTIKNVYIYAANEQLKIDIEKACNWISNNYNKYVSFGLDGEITFHDWKKDFIKAMEEEQ